MAVIESRRASDSRDHGDASALPAPTWSISVSLLALAVVAYFQSWIELWPYWENKNATYTHGTLVAAVTIWLVWRARRALGGLSPAPSPRVLPLVILLSAAWLLAARAHVFMIHVVLWPVLAFSIVWAGVGWLAASRFAFPLCFLYFAIPVWEYLKPPLQWISSTMVGLLTGMLGITATVDDAYVILPSGTIFIALDCSGAHFLSVALAVGVLAGVLRGDSARTRLLILAVAGVLSMIFNWLRILLIILAYTHPDLQRGLETIGHFTFGWWVFALDLVVFAIVLRFVPTSASTTQRRPVAYGGPHRPWSGRQSLLAAAAALLLPVSSWAISRLDQYPGAIAATVALPGFDGPYAADLRWQPEFSGAAWSHRIAYVGAEGAQLELFRNEYHEQSQGSEFVSNATPLFDPLFFRQEASAIVTLEGHSTLPLEVNRVELTDRSGQPWIAYFTYLIDRETVASARRAQLIMALRALYRRPAAGILATAMPCPSGCAAASSTAERAFVLAHDEYENAPRPE